jgi:hypothetical protein
MQNKTPTAIPQNIFIGGFPLLDGTLTLCRLSAPGFHPFLLRRPPQSTQLVKYTPAALDSVT